MSAPTTTRLIATVLALVAALAVSAIGGFSAFEKIATFQPLGFESRIEGGAWAVSDVSAAETGLEPGDRIVLANGVEPAGAGNLGKLLRRGGATELVVLRSGELATVAYRLPALEIDWAYLLLVLCGIAYLAIGLYTLLRDRTGPARLFYGWCLTSALVYLVSPVAPFDATGRVLYVLEEAARLLLAPLTLNLFIVFPRPLAARNRLLKIVPFLYLPAAFLLLLQLDLIAFSGRMLFGGQVRGAIATLDRLELFHLVLFALAATGILVWRLFRSQQREAYRQASWIAVGMAGGYIPFLGFYVIPHAFGAGVGSAWTALGVAPLALVPLTFAYAILRYKLWDIGVVVRDTLAVSLTALVGIIGFSLANLAASRVIPDQFALTRNLLAFATGLAIAGFMVPARRAIGSSLERIQYRGRFTRRRALAAIGREVVRERDLERLATILSERIAEALELTQANLYVRSGGALRVMRHDRGAPRQLPLDFLGDRLWSESVQSLAGAPFPVHDLHPVQRLHASGYRYAFPLTVREQRIGVFVTGYKEEDLPLNSDDVDLVRQAVDQASLAVENAQLLERVQRQLEEVTRLQQYNQGIIESSPAGIVAIDRSRKVVSANRAFALILGDKPGSTFEGKRLSEVLPIDLPDAGAALQETSFCDAAGIERHLQISLAPLAAGDEADLQVVVVQDVSERVQMEQALKERERLAALGVLAAGVAHEVNTPITGISSYAQMLLATTPKDDPRHEILEKVEKQTFRAARIVQNLLELSRERPRERSAMALSPVLTDAIEAAEGRIKERDVTVSWTPPETECSINGHPGELEQVFVNLILNGVDALPVGGEIRVGLEQRNGWVVASVSDDGPGIDEEVLDEIFRPFYSTKLASGGTGLGLSISADIVRKHGGRIRVESRPGEGSTFYVELPRLDAAS